MSFAITAYAVASASSTLGTANTLALGTGGNQTGLSTLIGTSTGYGELYAQGNVSAWPALGGLGAPSGHGWIYDPPTPLVGRRFAAGNWSATLALYENNIGCTASFYLRAYRRSSGGVYTLLGTIPIAGQALAVGVQTVVTFPAIAFLASATFATGDKLYLDLWANITTPDNNAAATIAVYQSPSAGLGNAAGFAVTTSGIQFANPTLGYSPLPGQVMTNGTSNFVCGACMTGPYVTPNFLTSATVQGLVKAAGMQIVRISVDPTNSDATIDSYVTAITNAGCVMMAVITTTADAAGTTRCQHVVSYLGNRCKLYEVLNEPDLASSPTISSAQYATFWNTTVPLLRAINPSAAFIGPVLSNPNNPGNYLSDWLLSVYASGILPDAVSFHQYPCFSISQSACSLLAGNYQAAITSTRDLVISLLGRELPICLTEWNFDPGNPPPSYGDDPAFMVPWTTNAYTSILQGNPAIATVFNICSGSGFGHLDLIDSTTQQPRTNGQYATLKLLSPCISVAVVSSTTPTVYTYGSTVLHDGQNYFLIEKPYNMVAYTQVLQKISRQEGMKKSGESVDARTIVCKIKVVGQSRADLEQRLSTMHAGLSIPQQPLTIHAIDSRYYIADAVITDEVLLNGLPISVLITVTFTCRQPYAYSATGSTYDTGIVQLVGSGTTWTMPVQNITGGGTVYSCPTIRVYQQVTNIAWTSTQIAQLIDARTIKIGAAASQPTVAGDYVDFFCDPMQPVSGHTIQKNNDTVLRNFSGQFPVMEPFTNPWIITVTAPSAPQVQVVWSWTPRYLP